MTYTEFKRMHIDLGALGAEGGRNAVRYTCTPKGAKIFGWAGVDGIHFCTVKGYGETIFSVSPMNPGQDCVQPLARDMGDFLRLLLACGDTAALEQAWMWTEAQFEEYLREYPPTEDQRAVMREIEEKCGLTPMEEPWRYLKKVRAETDCSGLRFEKEYEELLHPVCREPQEWEVYFEYGFGGKKPRHRPGREITLGKTFTWGKEEWLVPAMYCCSEGVVLDLLKNTACPLVLDADGINAAAGHIHIRKTERAPLVLTPHPGEMARLLGCSVAEVQRDRLETARRFAEERGVILVLKGHQTVLAAPGRSTMVNMTGNPGMAAAGSGDVLAGMIASLIAQGMEPFQAAMCGVHLHGLAGDRAAARLSQHAMQPTDMLEELCALFSELEQ